MRGFCALGALLVFSCASLQAQEDDYDLGELVVLQAPARPRLFRATSDTQYLYTSNVLLLPEQPPLKAVEDSLLLETVELTCSPQLLDRLATSLYLRYQIARYSAHTEDDFDAQAVGLNLSYPVMDWFNVYADWSASRMHLTRENDEFFKMYDTQFGLWRSQPLCSRASILFGYQFDWRASTPSVLTRIDNSFYTGLQLLLLKNLNAQLLYRLGLHDYQSGDRNDVNQLITFTVTYAFNDYVKLEAFTDYGHNNSDTAGRDYTVFDGGGGLNLSIRF